VSISPTFYEQLLRPNPFAKKLQTQIVSTKSCTKKHLYEKDAHKMLVKLTPGGKNWHLIYPNYA
jgi:hypothetical protein